MEGMTKKEGAGMGFITNKIQRSDLRPSDHIYSWRKLFTYSHHGIYVGNGYVIHFTGVGSRKSTGEARFESFIGSSAPPSGGRRTLVTAGVGSRNFRKGFESFVNPSTSHSSDASPCEKCGNIDLASGVLISCIDCFVSNDGLYRYQYGVSNAFFITRARGGTCTLAQSDEVDEVLHRATYLLQNGFGAYDLFKNNCEDFAVYCKTGLLVKESSSSGQVAALSATGAAASSMGRGVTFNSNGKAAIAVALGVVTYIANRIHDDIGVRKDSEKVAVEDLVARCNGDEAPDGAEETQNQSH